ncbi:dihydrofolate reductase family protein [Raineyella fluvialis]|uniref:Pyrimidine reductase family protein n=1 Tax=Raineyella fluvialis TaxID=2662261 RepID=A0A5Q2FEI4_9ACTN|nr:dihydrofolate reductase family protein [Raineyella fluvialis]QGF23493.1 pyrimidine reductase family protein [Raineyella fluvialis]
MTEIHQLTATGPALRALDLLAALGDAAGVRANMVTSADGHATIRGRVGDLTGEADQALLTALRGWCDVLLVGSGTIRAEGYGPLDLPTEIAEWRTLKGRVARPVLAIVSGSLDLDPSLPAFARAADAGPESLPWVITVPGADQERRTRLAPYARLLEVEAGPDGRPSLPAAVAALRQAGMTRVLSEGGPTVLGTLLGGGVVDELFLTVSPLLVGGGGLRIVETGTLSGMSGGTASGGSASGATPGEPVPLKLMDVHVAGSELFLRYAVGASAAASASSSGLA